MDRYCRRKQRQHPEEVLPPENRIPIIFPGIGIAAIGFLIYGWTAFYRVHWMTIDIGISIAMFEGQLSGMPLTAYTINAYPEHTSSALAATQFLQSLTAFLFPLFAPKVYEVIGYGWGNTMIGLLTLVFGLMPLALWFWRAKLRLKTQPTE